MPLQSKSPIDQRHAFRTNDTTCNTSSPSCCCRHGRRCRQYQIMIRNRRHRQAPLTFVKTTMLVMMMTTMAFQLFNTLTGDSGGMAVVVAASASSSSPLQNRHSDNANKQKYTMDENDDNRNNDNRNNDNDDGPGLTLGDLDQMMARKEQYMNLLGAAHAGSDNAAHYEGIGNDQHANDNGNTHQIQHQNQNQQQGTVSVNPHPIHRLRRINLDLSGRVMCHVLSPRRRGTIPNDASDPATSSSIPLFYVPSRGFSKHRNRRQHQHHIEDEQQHHHHQHHQQQNKSGLSNIPKNKQRIMQHIRLPHLYLGANYDLDEVWYGATRWIAKCCWNGVGVGGGGGNSVGGSSGGVGGISPITINLEGEQSVFDSCDSTIRLGLVHNLHRYNDNNNNNIPQSSSSLLQQKLVLEYDSTKYTSNKYSNAKHATPHYAPTMSMELQTPIMLPGFMNMRHPRHQHRHTDNKSHRYCCRRLEFHSKSTVILPTASGSISSNSATVSSTFSSSSSSSSSSVENRLLKIKERYKQSIPQSSSNGGRSHSSASSPVAPSPATKWKRIQQVGKRLSTWLDNDGWMPRKLSTTLMGNLVSVNEIGFLPEGQDFTSRTDVVLGGRDRAGGNGAGRNAFLPPLHNMGIRLRISKKIDWTSLGIFPWSSSSSSSSSSGQRSTNTSRNGGNGLLNSSSSKGSTTHLRLDLCGLYDSEERWAWVGVDVDPLDWRRSWKVVVGQADVRVLGNGQ